MQISFIIDFMSLTENQVSTYVNNPLSGRVLPGMPVSPMPLLFFFRFDVTKYNLNNTLQQISSRFNQQQTKSASVDFIRL